MRKLIFKKITLHVWEFLTESNTSKVSLVAEVLPEGVKRGKIRIAGTVYVKRNPSGGVFVDGVELFKTSIPALYEMAKIEEEKPFIDFFSDVALLQDALSKIFKRQDDNKKCLKGPGVSYSSDRDFD